jgi:polyisoprenyl-phosphate glycosyltransferase
LRQIYLIVPVYNEEEAIPKFAEEISRLAKSINPEKLHVIFVNDGSNDGTRKEIESIDSKVFKLTCLNLSRNFGKEAALTAGLQNSTGDAAVPIDVDLQDPPELINHLIREWKNGSDVVLARRLSRRQDSLFKRVSANLYYKILGSLAPTHIPENVGDFRLMSRKVVEAVNSLPETTRFMKGILSWVGFNVSYVDYVRVSRSSGRTSFNFRKLWTFGIDGITSFSIKPLKIWTYLGLVVSLVSLTFAIYLLIRVLVLGIETPGYASTMVAITLMGGLQLMGIGVIGEYLGRVFLETKRRPIYLISEIFKN